MILLLTVQAFGDVHTLATARNLGLAEYQNEEYARAAVHFREAVRLAPTSLDDRINLAISLLYARNHEPALADLNEARRLEPKSPHVAYLAGVTQARLDRFKEAGREFERLLSLDPLCVAAHYNLGVAFKKLGRLAEAAHQWEETIRLDPDHGPAHFQLFNYYTGRREALRAQRAFKEYMRTKEKGLGPGTSLSEVEKSRYMELIASPAMAKGNRSDEISVVFRDATAASGLAGIRAPFVRLADIDDDAFPDLIAGAQVYRNRNGRLAGPVIPPGIDPSRTNCADAADFNNDGKLDLVFCSGKRPLLLIGNGDFTFKEAKPLPECAAGTAPRHARFVDLDHEGDLDILVVCVAEKNASSRVLVLRNNGNETFADITHTSRIVAGKGAIVDLLFTDADFHNDIDVLLPSGQGDHRLFLNNRDGTFREMARKSGLSDMPGANFVVVGDINGDGAPDLILFGTDAVGIWNNVGDGRFIKDAGLRFPARTAQPTPPNFGVLADLDNDGDLDLLAFGSKSALYRNDGAGAWSEPEEASLQGLTIPPGKGNGTTADVDNDGDTDVIVASEGKIIYLRNDGGNANRSIRLRLFGRKNNMDGYGAKVWIKDGPFYLLRETFERWIDLGVGKRKKLDVVGLRWPTGITQNLLDVKVKEKEPLRFEERPGLAESCPFLFAFDGSGFRFITDILDTTPLGIQLVPGVPFEPNHREAVLIDGKRLREKNGLLSIRITQELAEITYLDRLRLHAFDHPKETRVIPGDRFSEPPYKPFTVYSVSQPSPPQTALDGAGHDIRRALIAADRVYAEDVKPVNPKYPGFTRLHEIVLDPGDPANSVRLWLFLRGTTLWPDASVNFAVAQNPEIATQAVALDVIGRDGRWLRVEDDIGLPAGVDKFLPVNLTGRIQHKDKRVRISTNLAVLWDQAFFGIDSNGASPRQETDLLPLRADLHYRGFSRIYSPDGKLPDLYRYEILQQVPPFENSHAGYFTAYGDVTELLYDADDRFVILAPGDEVAVDFPSAALPALQPGWVRDYVLDTGGWIKDGDFRTARPNTVEPLPFHGMSAYPPAKNYPDDKLHRRYLEDDQTRSLAAEGEKNGR